MYPVYVSISSGRRVNPYGDDIGGLSVSSRMNTDRASTAQLEETG